MSTHRQRRYFSLWPGGRGSPGLVWITMEGNHHTSSNHPHARAPASSQGLPHATSFATDTMWGYRSLMVQTWREGESQQGGLDAGNETENTKQRIWLWAPGRLGFPGGSDSKESACQCRKPRFNPWVRKICWRKKRQPNPVFLPGEFNGPRRPAGYSP